MIIGLGFAARSGKDTVADMLVQNYGFTKIAFADALKEGAQAVFGLTHDQLYGDLKEEVDEFWQDTPRNILQKMGTECMRRGYRDDIWIKALFRRIHAEEEESGESNWVIPDCRFPNEADAVKAHYGWLVKITRPEQVRDKIATKLHASETSMLAYDGWDDEILNDGFLEDLEERLDVTVARLMRREPVGRK